MTKKVHAQGTHKKHNAGPLTENWKGNLAQKERNTEFTQGRGRQLDAGCGVKHIREGKKSQNLTGHVD